jgi:hypothetical protein
MRPNETPEQFEARVTARQQDLTGPWQTVERHLGPVILTHRYRRRPKREFVALNMALDDLRDALLAPFVPVVEWLARHLPK